MSWILIAVVIAGIVLRLVAGRFSQGFYHPDEHQQYLEVAQGIAYGYHVRFWEEDRGTRCYVYSGMLAGLLHLLDQIGVREPVYQAIVIRELLCLSLFGCLLLFARRWLRQGHTVAACFLITTSALSPDLIFIGLRTLSETAMMIPLLLGIYLFRRRPVVAGLLFGLMFGLRFQSVFFTFAVGLIALYEDWRRVGWTGVFGILRGRTRVSGLLSVRMALGLVVAIFCVGLVDKLTLGDWFHSPLACFRANIGEGVAANYGVYPWTRYITWGRQNLLHISPFLFPLLFLGAFRKPGLALISVCAIAGHSVISHKEYRFLWPVLPLVFLMVAQGFEMAYLWLRQGWRRQHLTAVVGLSLLVGVAIRCWDIEWNPDPPRSSSLALAKLRHFPDVTGVALYQIGEGSSGNYFYLRRNIPLLTDPNRRNDDRQNLNICKARLRQNEGTVNYLITPSRNAFLFQEWRPEEVKIIHGMGIYRLHPRGGTVAQSS